MQYTIDEPKDPSVLTVRMDTSTDWQQRFLLISDIHIDSPHCDRTLLREHLEQAKELGAGILIVGDLLDVMQGKTDRRQSKSDLSADYLSGAYFSDVINDAEAFLKPYRKNIVMISDGNHETAVKKHHEIDLLDLLCRRLDVRHMGYSGFVQFKTQWTNQNGSKGKRSTRTMYFHHGGGGGGPVTKGVIKTNRRAVVYPDADIVVAGHIHEAWMLEIARERVTSHGVRRKDRQIHVQLATYKQEHNLEGGWHIEREAPPKPLGGWWLTFYYRNKSHGNVSFRLHRTSGE